MTTIEVDIISDFVCAWCYIGKRKLEQAISLYQKTYPGGKSDIFSIKWHPYYLNYNPHPHSVDKSELIDARLSGMAPEQRKSLFNRMDQVGRSVGIRFKGGGKIGSTRDAHRIVHLSQGYSAGVRNALVENIFKAYHELEKDISSSDVLRELAVDAGIEAADVDEWFCSGCASDAVEEDARKNKEMVHSGVPCFIIQRTHRIDGAEDPFEFIAAFSKAKDGELKA